MTAVKESVPARIDERFSGGMASVATVDVRGLRQRLSETVEGEVRFDAGTKALYATDASNYRQVPLGVVIPKNLDDVVATHRACHEFGAPVLARGGGTSLSGETVNFAVVIDVSKYLTRIGDADPVTQTVVCEPGVINEKLNEHTGAQIGMIFGPDPSTHSRCTVGGNIGNNSCGIHSVQSQLYGPGPRTSDSVEALEVVTHAGDRFWVGVGEEEQLEDIIAEGGRKGEIYAALRDLRDRYADLIRERYHPVDELPRRVSGYNLDELLPERGFNVARALTGTEGTCVTVTQVKYKLTPALLQRTLVVVEYDELPDAAEHCMEIIETWRPIGLEALDHLLIEDQLVKGEHVSDIKELPRRERPDAAWLLVQFGADQPGESEDTAERFKRWLVDEKGHEPERILITASKQEGGQSQDLWEIREGGLGSTAFPPDGRDHWPGWEDSAVPPEKLGDYIRDLRALYDRYDLRGAMYGHFGQGCIHSRISFDLRHADGIRKYRAFLEEAADLVCSYGGSLSGEHGDGQQRAELLERQYGPELLDAMREFKRIWDPDWKMNPGKVVDPYRLDEHLKLGTDYNPWRPPVRFAYSLDKGDFAHHTLRCVGIGKCRVPDASTVMCPSYMVTREEKHSTRGRARLLFEMLQGEVITDRWQSKEVYDALDLCLACKGCTSDCPVQVDMPTMKSEFLHHHFRSIRRWRPRYAYAFGLIDQAARLASRVPELVNLVTQTPGLQRVAKACAGMAPQREIPTFAPITLQRWWRERGTANPGGPRVLLWPDTFNNHFHTDVGVACVQAIEAAGWQVVIPEGHVCCGRPLYDYGFLGLGERYLHNTLDVLRDEIRQGTPVVGMEPSCLAVFKDELTGMLPHDDDAQRLARSAMHFAEFFERHQIAVPRLERKAIVWGHCHHKATGGMDPEHALLQRMGVQVEPVSGGCCGLAGSWGFETGHHEISMQCGEQALLPAVRDADGQTLVIANGFSCKTQIEQAHVGRNALHVAQAMMMAHEHGIDGYRGGHPEDPYHEVKPQAPARLRATRLAAAGGAATATAGAAGVLVSRLRGR